MDQPTSHRAVEITLLESDGQTERMRPKGCITRVDLTKGKPEVVTSVDAVRIANVFHGVNQKRAEDGKGPKYLIRPVAGGRGDDYENDVLDPGLLPEPELAKKDAKDAKPKAK